MSTSTSFPTRTLDDVVRALRAHLDDHGFADVETRLGTMLLARAGVLGTPLANATLAAAAAVYGEPFVYPQLPAPGRRA